MVQFKCPRVIHPLISFTFGVHCGLPFSLHAGKGTCCMWLVKKVENHFAKMGFVDSKWSNQNASGSQTHWCHSLFESIMESHFLCMQEKGNAASGLSISVILLFKNRFCGLQMVQFECPRVIHPLVSVTLTKKVFQGQFWAANVNMTYFGTKRTTGVSKMLESKASGIHGL